MQNNNPPLKKILIVSEDELLRSLISTCLSGLQNPIIESSNAKEALQLISQAPRIFEILITDNQMSVLTGIELIMLLREIDHTFQKIILTSSDIEDNPDISALIKIESKVKLLEKPFSPKQLLEKVLS